MGTDEAGIFALIENSLDMNELNIFSFWDPVDFDNGFEKILLDCKVMPSSN